MILIDTHVLVWLAQGNPTLGLKARSLIDKELKTNTLFISAFTFWELAMLMLKKRIDLQATVEDFRHNVLQLGVQEITLDGRTGIYAAELKHFHGDPADRILTATALTLGATFLTADKKILSWSGELRRINARQ